jgi:hypothetical protein
MSPRERQATEKYYADLIAWEDKASAFNTPVGGVRSREIVALGPPPTVPRTTPEWIADTGTKLLVTAGLTYGAGTMFDWFGGIDADAVSVMDAVDAGSQADEVISLTDVDWNAVAEGWEAGQAITATQNVDLASSWLSIPAWAEKASDWTIDLGKKAVEQIVKSEISERYAPTPTLRNPVVNYSSLPQQNISPLSGLAGWLYPNLGQRTGGYSSSSGSSLPFFGFGSGSPISPKSGDSQALGMPFNASTMIWVIVAGALITMLALFIRR